jgi:hypothetical protein
LIGAIASRSKKLVMQRAKEGPKRDIVKWDDFSPYEISSIQHMKGSILAP